MSPTERPIDPTLTRGAQLDDDIVVIDLTGAEPVVTHRSTLVDLREAVDGRIRDGRWGLLVILAALQVLDVFTTHLVLGNGGAEGNPIMASIVSDGWGGTLIVKLVAIALLAAIVDRCPADSVLVTRGLTAVTGIYAAIVAWNLAVLLALI